jgi:hypothetical protein
MNMNFLDIIEKNPWWAAALTAVTASFFYFVRNLPSILWNMVIKATTLRLEIVGSDPSFEYVDSWLSKTSKSGKARTFKVAMEGGRFQKTFKLIPGYGTHFFWDNGPVWIRRVFDKDVSTNMFYNDTPQERIVITVLGRNQKRLLDLVATMQEKLEEKNGLVIKIWHTGQWITLPVKHKRPIESVLLPTEQREEILNHTKWFINSKKWFFDRGVPWRCSYMFDGPPGTGKTSLITALAGHFDKPVCIINLSTVPNDNDLLNAFTMGGADSIILIEDIDAADTSAKRVEIVETDPKKPNAPSESKKEEKKGVTLSGLLNAIDGVASSEGRLLVMTTNHPEKLDSALVRGGRVDKRWTIGCLGPDLVEEMAIRFFPDDFVFHEVARIKAENNPLRPAVEWQAEFMERARDAMKCS